MKHYYPAYYAPFQCIAAACPDSCCQGWDVVIDSDTETFYRTVQSGFGKRLQKAIYTDSDGDRIFELAEQKKCPFWGEDKLCEIYQELGEEHLCLTCAQFPRLKMEYADFTEHSLALACPEAARLILSADSAYESFTHTAAKGCDAYSEELIRTLLHARRRTATRLTAEKPLSKRLGDILTYIREVQDRISPYDEGDTRADCAESLSELFRELEYIDDSNREVISQACRSADLSEHEAQLTRLALYYLYRYFLNAVDTLDVLTPIKHMVISVVIVANLAQKLPIETAAQRYSKETEQSYENMERLFDTLAYVPRFSSDNIITLFR